MIYHREEGVGQGGSAATNLVFPDRKNQCSPTHMEPIDIFISKT